ncbi:hypothetical protein ACJJTC_002412 [Scirpophaga incertulas]
MYKHEELRKLPTGSLNRVSQTLETNGDWRKVFVIIPKDLNAEKFEPKYNSEDMRAIEEHAQIMRKPCAEVLFDEWGTSGRNRPTLATLQKLILQAGIYKAADEIALMLHEAPPPRPNVGPAAKIDTNLSMLLKSTKSSQGTQSTAQIKSKNFPSFSKIMKSTGNRLTASVKSEERTDETSVREFSGHYSEDTSCSANIPNLDMLINNNEDSNERSALTSVVYPTPAPFFRIDTAIIENKTLIKFDFEELKEVTSNFSSAFIYGPRGPTGMIGSGGFGDVYAGLHPKHGLLAVKKFKDLSFLTVKPDLVSQTFNAEVNCLAQLRHENIVPIIGYSIRESSPQHEVCIVCQYIEGGSLEQNLLAKKLTEKQRIDIMIGTANGLRYIHNRDSVGVRAANEMDTTYLHYIHGDVKSANILLTTDFQPKLCDFGLAKQFKNTQVTPMMMGTGPYMAPEQFNGTVTQKIDIFSFGVVILELITGLQSLVNKEKEVITLRDHVAEQLKQGNLEDILDKVVSPWESAEKMYEVAMMCLEKDYVKRPKIDVVYEQLITLKPVNGNSVGELDSV